MVLRFAIRVVQADNQRDRPVVAVRIAPAAHAGQQVDRRAGRLQSSFTDFGIVCGHAPFGLKSMIGFGFVSSCGSTSWNGTPFTVRGDQSAKISRSPGESLL